MTKFTDVYTGGEWARITRERRDCVPPPNPATFRFPPLAAPAEQDFVRGYCAGIGTATIVFATIIGALLWHLC